MMGILGMLLNILLLRLLIHHMYPAVLGSSSDWLLPTDECPTPCVCHKIWSDQLREIVNAVDCRKMGLSRALPNHTEAALLADYRFNSVISGDLTSLRQLDLSRTELKLHHIDSLKILFTLLKGLKALDLSDNRIESLPRDVFCQLPALEYLALANNALISIHSKAFHPLNGLKQLDLSDNFLQQISPVWFRNASQLRSLNISGNKLQSLPAGAFQQTTQLRTLDASENNISFLDPYAFPPGSLLEDMNLRANQFTAFPSADLSNLRELKILNFDQNILYKLPSYSVSNFSKLLKISFAEMPQLQLVDKNAFANLPALREVNMFENRHLRYLSHDAFYNCSSIVSLYLHNCALPSIDQRLFLKLPNLEELTLYNNPTTCGCVSEWMLKLLNGSHLNSNNIDFLDGDKIVCSEPLPLRGATLVSLSHEQMTIHCDPIVVPFFNTQVYVRDGSEVNLDCRAIGVTVLSWILPDQSVVYTNGSGHLATINNIDGSLRLSAATSGSEGTYTCSATSANGFSDSESVYIRLLDPVIELTPVAVSSNFVSISWNFTSSSFTALTYHKARTASPIMTIMLAERSTSCTVTGLNSSTDYLFCLLFASRSDQRCLSVRTLSERRDDIFYAKSPSNLGTPVQYALAVTVMVGSVTSSAVLLVVVVRRVRRRRRKTIPYKSQLNDRFTDQDVALEDCYRSTTEPLRIDET